MGLEFKFHLSWTTHINRLVGKARQRLYHLGELMKYKDSQRILQSFYSGAVESII